MFLISGGRQGGFGGQGGTGTQGFGQAPGGTGAQGGTGTQGFGTRGGGGAGGLLGGAVDVDAALVTALRSDAADYTWAAAAVGSQNAANYQLASGEAVMPIGGFNGSDPSPTLAQFQQYVAEGRIHFFIASGMRGGGSNGGSSASAEIAAWVESSFTSSTVGGVTVYDLSSGSTVQGA